MDNFHGRDLIHNYAFDKGSDFYKKHSVAIISTLGGFKIEGLTGENPINLGFQSNFGGNPIGDAMESGIKSAVDAGVNDLKGSRRGSLNKAGKVLGAVANNAGLAASAMGYGTQTLASTLSMFESAATVPLTIDLFIMKEFAGGSYADIVKNSLRLSTPDSFGGDYLVAAPLKYSPYTGAGVNPAKAVNESNTCTIVCGEQLRITHMLCENFSYSPSVQLREDGSPVYIKCTYSFKTGRVLSWEEYYNWFKKL